MYDAENTLFALAADFIQYTNRSVFLTGKAGTGKTTFLKFIRQSTIKQTAIVAPTGVAAINAGGVTIHSFFQLPFTPFIPSVSREDRNIGSRQEGTDGSSSSGLPDFRSSGHSDSPTSIDKHALIGRIKLNGERRKVLQQLELLVIDEISMVRCDVLDAIDAVLRHFRNRYHEPFGGVQLLFIGDMFQLPPVVPNEEWGILSQFYNSPYFFDSRVIAQQAPVHIELNKIYRQNEQHFIDLLNKVRNNIMDEAGFEILNKHYNPNFEPKKDDGYITLSTHNYKADAINAEELARLTDKPVTYTATVTGEFFEKAYPADERLLLKKGAQVMFIKNDKDKERRFFNGKIGVITKLTNDVIHVQCKGEPAEIEVKKEKWESIKYTFDKTSQQVEEEEAGTFEQFPLRLAWAITIHKSQGLTFEKAIIDAGAAFAPGQVYVALSRCTTLQGIILKSRITSAGLRSDPHIMRFAQQKHPSDHLTEELQLAKIQYQRTILKQLFNFSQPSFALAQLAKTVEEHADAFNVETKPWLEALQDKLFAVEETAKKFEPQLQKLLAADAVPDLNEALQQRLKAAAAYFIKELQAISQLLPQSPAVTDSKQYALAYNEDIKEFHAQLSQKLYAINSCANGFNAHAFNEEKNHFKLPPLHVNAYAGAGAGANSKTDSPHPALHKQLRQLRDTLCNELNQPVYMVASGNTLDEMAMYLPQTKEQLQHISGFGKAKTEKFGQRFLDIITEYSELHNLDSQIAQKKAKPPKSKGEYTPNPSVIPKKSDTKEETYKLFKDGKSVDDIAKERSLTTSTIESHLAHYVQLGILPIHELVTKEKLVLIEPALQTFEGGSITPLKEQLGEQVSYGEIRLVLAWREYEKTKTL